MRSTFIAVFVILSFLTSAYDLSNLEESFVDSGEITCYVVVGDNGSSSDVLAQLDIINYLGKFSSSPPMGIAKLASEVEDIYSQDIISIGNPCINPVTSEIMGYDGDCVFEDGIMRFYDNRGKTQLVIYGASEESTREAVSSVTGNEVHGEQAVVELTLEEKNDRQKEMEELLRRTEENRERPHETLEEEAIPEAEPVVEEKEEGIFSAIMNFFKRLFAK